MAEIKVGDRTYTFDEVNALLQAAGHLVQPRAAVETPEALMKKKLDTFMALVQHYAFTFKNLSSPSDEEIHLGEAMFRQVIMLNQFGTLEAMGEENVERWLTIFGNFWASNPWTFASRIVTPSANLNDSLIPNLKSGQDVTQALYVFGGVLRKEVLQSAGIYDLKEAEKGALLSPQGWLLAINNMIAFLHELSARLQRCKLSPPAPLPPNWQEKIDMVLATVMEWRRELAIVSGTISHLLLTLCPASLLSATLARMWRSAHGVFSQSFVRVIERGMAEPLLWLKMDPSKAAVHVEWGRLVQEYARRIKEGACLSYLVVADRPAARDQERPSLHHRDQEHRGYRDRGDEPSSKSARTRDEDKEKGKMSRDYEDTRDGKSQVDSWKKLVGKLEEADLRKFKFQYCHSVIKKGAECKGGTADKCRYYHIGCSKCLNDGVSIDQCDHSPVDCPK